MKQSGGPCPLKAVAAVSQRWQLEDDQMDALGLLLQESIRLNVNNHHLSIYFLDERLWAHVFVPRDSSYKLVQAKTAPASAWSNPQNL